MYAPKRIERFEERLQNYLAKKDRPLTMDKFYSIECFSMITAPPWIVKRKPKKNHDRDFLIDMRVRCKTSGTRANKLVLAAYGPIAPKKRAATQVMHYYFNHGNFIITLLKIYFSVTKLET